MGYGIASRVLGWQPPASWAVTSNDQNGVSGSPRSSNSQVMQCALLPRCDKVFPAQLAVNQADDDVPHTPTPLFDPWSWYQPFVSRCLRGIMKMASSARRNGFVVFAR